MIAKALPKACWSQFFDRLSRSTGLREVEMNINALKLGARIQAHWTGRPAMSYDSRHGAFTITLGDLHHRISPVRDIFISNVNDGLEGVDVIEHDGTRHTIRLKVLRAMAVPAHHPLPANSRAAIKTARAVPTLAA